MDRTTALSAAGAFTLTAVAAVSALFFTMGAGADTSGEPTTPVVAEQVVTEYEVVQLDPIAEPAAGADLEVAAAAGEMFGDAEAAEYEGEHENEGENDEYEEEDDD